MLTRIVTMTLKEEYISKFIDIFKERKEKIKSQSGCNDVDVFQDAHRKNICVTISHWDSEDDLNQYRHSELFKETWSIVKPMFSERAQAISLYKLS